MTASLDASKKEQSADMCCNMINLKSTVSVKEAEYKELHAVMLFIWNVPNRKYVSGCLGLGVGMHGVG